MDWERTAPSNKRPFQELDIPEACNIPSSSRSAVIVVEDDEDERPEKCARPDADSEQTTQELLVEVANIDTPTGNPASEPTEEGQWVSTVVGVTTMFFNQALNMYKCAGCNYRKESSYSVATHYGRYCPGNPKATQARVKQEDVEDII